MAQKRIKVKKGAERKHVAKVMRMAHKGKLKTAGGRTVTSPEQAAAIGYSEVRRGRKRGWTKRASATEPGRVRKRPKLTARGRARAKGKRSR